MKQKCPKCGREVEAVNHPGTDRLRLVTHGPGPEGEFICPGSGDAAMVAAAQHLNVNDIK